MNKKVLGVALAIVLTCILLPGLSLAAGEMFSGVGDVNVMVGSTFDAMAGVSAENSGTALDVEISDITASDGSLTFTSGMTSFTVSSTAGVTYTVIYDAYDPADTGHTNSLDTATREVMAVGLGDIQITSTDFTESQTTYSIYNDIEGSSFTVKYTPPTEGANSTVLVIECPEYGAQFAALPVANSAVSSAEYLNTEKTIMAVILNDGVTEEMALQFQLQRVAISQDAAADWMDDESMETSITATEVVGSVSGGVLNIMAQATELTYCTMSPESTGTASLDATHTYSATVSAQALVTNYMLENVGDYLTSTYGAYFGSNVNGMLRYEIPSVDNGNPLIEITSIKVYVPDEKLKLTAVGSTGSVSSLGAARDLTASDFDEIWDEWTISTRLSDSGGSYYIITPDTRWFNTGDDSDFTDAFYGLRLVWQLLDTNNSLDCSTEEGTLTSFNAADTVVYYQTAGGSSENYTHTGPSVQTRAQVEGDITTAYAKNRREDLAYLSPAVIGASYTESVLTYTSNAHYRVSKTTESVPDYTGSVTQEYTFPYEIQPTTLYLSRNMIYSYLAENDVVLASLEYTTSGGSTHSATATELDAINDYYSEASSTEPVFEFAIPDGERVTSVTLTWSSLVVAQAYRSTFTLPPYTNDETTGALSGGFSVVTEHMDFSVPSDATAGDYQVEYTMTTTDGSGSTYSDEKYLWYRVIVPLEPTLYSAAGTVPETGNVNYNVEIVADGTDTSSTNMGSVYFNIGSEDSCIDYLENPVIDFGMKFSLENDSDSIYKDNTLEGITEEEGLAFLTGKFTATKYLNGWTFTYTTNLNSSDRTYDVIGLTEDTEIDLGLGEGEYFTSLSLSYSGNFYLYSDYEDTGSTLYLIESIDLQTLTENPFSGEALYTTTDYDYCAIVLQATWYSDNCDNDSSDNAEEMGSPYRTTNPREEIGAQYRICWSRQAVLDKPETELDEDADTTPQGGTSEFSADFSLTEISGGSPSTDVFKQRFYDEYGLTNSTWYWQLNGIPWSYQEAVYIELTDDEFIVDLSTTYLFGMAADSEYVEHEIVETGGSKYLKLWFADGFNRSMLDDANNGYMGCFENAVIFYRNTTSTDLAGNITVGFKTLPGCTVGTHYPIGKIYIDFSASLDDYDAPNDSAEDNPTRTDIVFSDAVEDTLELSSTETTEEKLWEYDVSKGSTTPYAVEVTLQAVLGADFVPGIGEIYEWSTYEVEFQEEENDNLDSLFSVTASDDDDIYDLTAYIYIPKEGSTVKYLDEYSVEQTATSEYDMYLTGIEELGTSGALGATYSYTTESDPDENSAYTSGLPGTEAEWRAVTAIKVEVPFIAQETGFNINLELAADKTVIGDQYDYLGGFISYGLVDDQTTPYTKLMFLGTYKYLDYTVVNTSNVWYDTYDEDGTQGQTIDTGSAYETAAEGVTINLYDTDGTTLIDSTTTDSSGSFSLSSYTDDAGQILEIVLPAYAVPGDATSGSANWALAEMSAEDYDSSLYDSDFNRTTLRLTLTELTEGALDNISVGLVRLPDLDAGLLTQGTPPSGYTGNTFSNVGTTSDPIYQRDDSGDYYIATLELYEGETASITAILQDYYDGDLPSGDTYNITYVRVNDTAVATAFPASGDYELTGASTTAYNQDISITGVSEGETYLEIQTTNALGDVVTARAHIIVLDLVDYDMPDVSISLTGSPYSGYSEAFTAEVEKGEVGYPDADSMSGTTSVFMVAGTETLPDFGTMTFSETGTYTYTFKQDLPSTPESYMDYDMSEYTLTIEITDEDGDGTFEIDAVIKKTVDEDGNVIAEAEQTEHTSDITFTNNYEPASYTYTMPEVQNTLTSTSGDLPTGFSDTFTANAAPEDAGWPAVDTGTGSVTMTRLTTSSFPALGSVEITEVGDYTYTITETQGVTSGMKYDQSEYTIAFSVVDNKGTLELDGTVTITKTKDSEGDTAEELVTMVSFENEYTKHSVVVADPPVSKIISGGIPATSEVFMFRMEAISYTAPSGSSSAMTPAQMPMPSGSSDGIKDITITGAGSEEFGDYTYELPGTYVYEISEVAGTNTQYAYSELAYTITDVVAYNANGMLGYTRTISRSDGETYSEADGFAFVNRYMADGSLTIKMTVSGDIADTEKEFAFTVTFEAEGDYTYTGSYSGTISSGDTIQLKDGESITITGLPAGTAYTVTESDYGSYQQVSTGSSGIIISDMTRTASFVNTLSSVPETGDDNIRTTGLLILIIGIVGFGLFTVLRYKNHVVIKWLNALSGKISK